MFSDIIHRPPAHFTALVLLLLFTALPLPASAQTMTYDQIKAALDANPPGTEDLFPRKQAILQLDEYLKQPTAPAPYWTEYREFISDMMLGLADELALPVPSGARIWQMYNHGYIIKTPSSTFAFDLVNPYGGYVLPNSVLEQIDVSFTSHEHSDHWGLPRIRIAQLGGECVTVNTLPPRSQATIRGLEVSSYVGLHNTANNIYHVTTPEGLTIMHTGDTQHSRYLPSDVPTEILLINAWMNESGSQSNITGVRNGINRVQPDLTIPGHVQELGHAAASRVTYVSALAVDYVPIPGVYTVMVPGEYYDYNVVPEPAFLALGSLAAALFLARRR